MRRGIFIIIGIAIIICGSSAAIATGLYAVDGADNAGGGPSTLYKLDPATGAIIQTIGPVGFDAVKGLAIHPTAGILCGVVSDQHDGLYELITIDPGTGAGTLVGGTTKVISDIDFSANGVLYGWSEHDGEDDLVTIDLTTGVATVVGDSLLPTGSSGLGFDGGGRLILKNYEPTLYEMNIATGAPAYLANLAPPPGGNGYRNVLAFNPDNGLMYTAEKDVDPAPIYTFNPAAGTDPIPTTLIGTGPSGLTALAFGDPIATDAGLNGQTITAEWLHPTSADVIESHVVVVGLPVELPEDVIISSNLLSIDLGGRSVRFDFSAGTTWGDAQFNGWRFTDTLGVLDDFGGFRIAEISAGITGLEESDLGWDADSVWANFAGVQVAGAGEYVVLEVQNCGLFCDGFESGDTTLWNNTVGYMPPSYLVADGPPYGTNPPVYSCLDACALLFGGIPGDYQCSTSDVVIDNQGNASTWGTGCGIVAEDYKLDQGTGYNCGTPGCATSAYVLDNCQSGETNYCWPQ